MSSRARRRVGIDALLVAGGTGGHVYPAIAVADVLTSGAGPWTVRFAVDARPASHAAVVRSGYAADVLPIRRGLQRRHIMASLRAALDAVRATVVAWRLVRRYRPRVVVGFGAYVTVPAILAARVQRVPLVVHEQNRRPGLANRLAVRLGATAAISLPATPLRGAQLTGNPVRPDIVGLVRRPQAPPLVGVVGASLGAGVLNDAALGLYERWRHRADVAIHHVSGAVHHEACARHLDELRRAGDRLDYTLVPYEHDMAGLYRRATVMVTRAGGSLAELAVAGVPAVVVPWSGAAEDHQRANADAFASAGAAVHLREAGCTAERLAGVLEPLLADPARLASMTDALRTLARPDAAARLAAIIESKAA
jgi:UDP-N-acetylglucosamine--N-acetylmuramyl-(pentapeptide) pyrophosphoryl-undecaprenol N-acetylglucosamine transferase